MRVAVNGVRLYVDVDGSGLVPDGPAMRERPTVLLIHGGPGSDHTTFKPIMDNLSAHAQVVYYDHRGMGRSDAGDPKDWTLRQWADDVAGLLDALEIEKPYVVGASFGGFVAQAFATAYPDRASKLALLCTGPRGDTDLSVEVFTQFGGPEAGDAARRFLGGDMGAFEDYGRYCVPHYNVSDVDMSVHTRSVPSPGTLAAFFAQGGDWHSFDFRSALANIQCPTLVLHGDLDPIVPLPLALELYDAIPEQYSQLEVFHGVGHGWYDKPEAWQKALETFLFPDETEE